MPELTFSTMTLEDLKAVVDLQEGAIGRYDWNDVMSIVLTEHEQRRVMEVSAYLLDRYFSKVMLLYQSAITCLRLVALLFIICSGCGLPEGKF